VNTEVSVHHTAHHRENIQEITSCLLAFKTRTDSMKVGEDKNKERSEKFKKGAKRSRIKLVKRLNDGLFRNVVNESTTELETGENKHKETISRKETEQKEDVLTNHLEETVQSLNYSKPEIDIDNVGKEEIIVTYCNVKNDENS
jgi:hypothetical protein